MQKEVSIQGTGDKVEVGDRVTVHCTGLLDGVEPTKFWSTSDPGQQPFSFTAGIGQVIQGWDETVLTMTCGEVCRVKIPSEKAYAKKGFPDWGIPPDADLIFDIDLVDIRKGKK